MSLTLDPALRHISVISLFAEDVKATKAFYQEVFGVPVVFEDEVSAVLKFDNLLINLLHVDNAVEIVAPGAVARDRSGSRFQLSIWLKDVDAVYERLISLGVAVHGPINRAWGKRTVNFVDPAGHSWEIAHDI